MEHFGSFQWNNVMNHSVFDGTNRTKAQFALNLRKEFMEHIRQIDPSFLESCPFSHMNPAGFMRKMCVFPFKETMNDFPLWTDDQIWSTRNYAFFVPKEYLLETEMWWRQHNDASLASFAFHVNTGCEDNSHTIWTTVNEGYAFKTDPTGLICCHSGPAGCYCDMVSFTVPDGECLTGNYAVETLESFCTQHKRRVDDVNRLTNLTSSIDVKTYPRH